MSAGYACEYIRCELIHGRFRLRCRCHERWAMRGRSRASPLHLELLLAQLDTIFDGFRGESLRLRRDTAVVLHGCSPQWRLMMDSVSRGPAPNSTMTRSRNERPVDLSRPASVLWVRVAAIKRPGWRADGADCGTDIAEARKVGNWSCARSMSYGAVECESVSRLGVLSTAGRLREMCAAMRSSVALSQEQVGKSRCQGRGLRGEVGDGGGVRWTW